MTVPWRDWSTPVRVRAVAGGTIAVAVALAVLLSYALSGVKDDLYVIGHETGPQVEATSDLYFALADMDAQIANVLLVGSATDLGLTRAQALDLYEKRRLEADADLRQAAAAGADIGPVLDPLGRYEALAAQTIELSSAHPQPARPDPAALNRYRQATDLMRETLLPAAQRLTQRNSAILEQAYTQGRGSVVDARLWTIVIGFTLLVVLVGGQLYLGRRFRRRISPALLAATVLAAGLVIGSTALLTSEAEHLRGAKKDAFDSVLALSQARAVSYDANADESRYLVDPERAQQYQAAFLAKSHQLVGLGDVGISGYDAALGQALDAYHADQSDLRFHGHFGTEFRNITFIGERAAAEKALAAYQVYQGDDRRIRDLVTGGRLDEAIAFCTSYAPGDSNWAFGQYDDALTALIGINRDAFARSVAAGEGDLTGRSLVVWILTTVLVGLVLLGVRRRLAEYR